MIHSTSAKEPKRQQIKKAPESGPIGGAQIKPQKEKIMIPRNIPMVLARQLVVVGFITLLGAWLVDHYFPEERPAYDHVPSLRGISVSESIKTHGIANPAPRIEDTPGIVRMEGGPSEMLAGVTGNLGIGITAPLHPLVIQGDEGEILRIESNGDIFLRGKKIGHDDHIVRDLRQAFPGTEEKARWRALQETVDATGRRIYHIDPETGDLGIGTPPNREELKHTPMRPHPAGRAH